MATSSPNTPPPPPPPPLLYPPKHNDDLRAMFAVGALASVLNNRKYSRARIEATLPEKDTTTTVPHKKKQKTTHATTNFTGRIRVRFADDATAHIRPTKLVPHPLPTERACYITPTTDLYRRFAKTQGTPEDIFIEVGSDFGETTSIMSERCEFVVGLDKSDSHVIESRVRWPKCQFVTADVLKNPECLHTCRAMFPRLPGGGLRKCVVMIDINGNRPMDAVNACVKVVEKYLQPMVMVVKSKELYTHYGGRKY